MRENFDEWFCQSKVVDEKGEPLVVFHGTTEDFDAFDQAKTGGNYRQGEDAFFFTSSTRTASNYAERCGSGANVIPSYLSLQNPYMSRASDPIDRYDVMIMPERHALEAQGYDGVIVKSTSDRRDLYVTFHSRQIKSALANSGLYLKDSTSLSDRTEALAPQSDVKVMAKAKRAKAVVKKANKKANHAKALA